MIEICLTAIALMILGVIIFRRSGGIFALPFVCFAYLACLYLGALSQYLENGSNTYLHMVLAGGALALGIYLAGDNPLKKSSKKPQPQVEPEVGLHPKIFLYTLGVITPLSVLVSLQTVVTVGIPLLSNDVTRQMIAMSSGPLHRLLQTLGSDNLLFLCVGWFVLYRLKRKRVYLVPCIFCLLAGLFFMSLFGSKASGLSVMIWLVFSIFYFTRRTPKASVLILMGSLALATTYIVTAYHYIPVPGMNPLAAFYERLTKGAVDAANYLLQVWIPRYGHAGFGPFHAEINRIFADVTRRPKSVLFNEYIWNLQNGAGQYSTHTGFSDSLFLYGTGVASFGVWFGVLLVGLFGFAAQKLNRYLLLTKKIDFLTFVGAMYLMYALFMETWIAGMPIIAFQYFAIGFIPKCILFLAVYAFLALPFRIPLRWSKYRATHLGLVEAARKSGQRGRTSSDMTPDSPGGMRCRQPGFALRGEDRRKP